MTMSGWAAVATPTIVTALASVATTAMRLIKVSPIEFEKRNYYVT
jgi:hypothetical protein